MQSIGRATAKILDHVGENFGILGAAEKDSGHEVRRFGEETLFMALRDHNVDAIKASGVKRIVTADPHAYNALKHDYKDVPPVEHISQVIAREVKAGKIQVQSGGKRKQRLRLPRSLLSGTAQPDLRRPSRCAGCDSRFEESRNEPLPRPLVLLRWWWTDAVLRAERRSADGREASQMAAEAGANVIVTACPFCMVNIEDAIKVAGLEGKMTAIDLAELVEQQIARDVEVRTDSLLNNSISCHPEQSEGSAVLANSRCRFLVASLLGMTMA